MFGFHWNCWLFLGGKVRRCYWPLNSNYILWFCWRYLKGSPRSPRPGSWRARLRKDPAHVITRPVPGSNFWNPTLSISFCTFPVIKGKLLSLSLHTTNNVPQKLYVILDLMRYQTFVSHTSMGKVGATFSQKIYRYVTEREYMEKQLLDRFSIDLKMVRMWRSPEVYSVLCGIPSL